ncbi:hypothetical protein [Aliikangiella coralliicola]|uniref:Uncharacterized protein n=1 Tax=Aliikangiella coralliicola TaxID=2592383 RepID=A0A545U092_9GAMM|nr:hypothetical protein [Aliikangiella coralliicola]TQV82885.1 hypothetical protein FLL46_24250 [Aliikangiella coralliicola]
MKIRPVQEKDLSRDPYKAPDTHQELLVKAKRNLITRLICCVLWFFFLGYVISTATNFVVVLETAQEPHIQKSVDALDEHFELTHDQKASLAAGMAINQFKDSYGYIIWGGNVLLSFILFYFGVLPGTSKFKYIKCDDVDELWVEPPTKVNIEKTDDVNENIRRYKEAQRKAVLNSKQ